MLDKCPKETSCGTRHPYWTDDAMPDSVGIPTTVKAYTVEGNNCKAHPIAVQVIRCSRTSHDFVYRYAGEYAGFCGKNRLLIYSITYFHDFTCLYVH